MPAPGVVVTRGGNGDGKSGAARVLVFVTAGSNAVPGSPSLSSSAVIKISDLADSVELDRQAMASIAGGSRERMRSSFRILHADPQRVVDYPGVPMKDVPVQQPGPFVHKLVSE
nr:hypothetical protein [Caballeronia sp. AZ10_KS36]